MRVKLLASAKSDLREHGKYYRETGGATLARRMLARMKTPMLTLVDNPRMA
ncbi:type II toxin-antitoxin system RelE/ParE family toxin [Propionivibrio sp.]|uniref:type II toxin-antitoxin system RelE/ParE family toxin n=1 Tax=Propionivibrio sp. TaxID=2212460 RepID=UPI003BEFECB7